MKELFQSIEKLSGSEAKNILFNIMHRIKMIKESEDLNEETLEEIYHLYEAILNDSPNNRAVEREFDTVHIVCGESPAGSLRYGLDRKNKVIGMPDFFAIGPLCKLDKDEGRKDRYEWLKDHLNFEMDDIEEEFKGRFSKTLAEIEAIPNHVPIVIWTGENADEQTGMRFVLNLLKDKTNDIHLINTTIAYQELFNTREYQYFYFHTGQVDPEKLYLIYQRKLTNPLSMEKRQKLEAEWRTLSETIEVLRIWQDNNIKSVNENYFDELIITTAQKLHDEQSEKDFMKSARLIGELLGHMEHSVGDVFLEYRLRYLIYNGVFEIKGIPKAMRYYSVKLS